MDLSQILSFIGSYWYWLLLGIIALIILIKIVPRTMKAGEFEEVIGIFTMPEYINTVGVCCSVDEQRNRHDFIYFDEIALYELPEK